MTTVPYQATEPGNPTEPDFRNPVTPDYEGREGMAAPGQEELLQQFMREQEQEARQRENPTLLAGKYKSPEELERAYKELESKLGQQSQQKEEAPADVAYTKDAAQQIYGEAAVNKLAERGIDMAQLMQQADSGADISQHYDALAETFGVSRQVVENYVSKAQVPGAGAQQAVLTESDAAELRQMVGGDEKFQELSGWAAKNLTKEALAEYNAVVDSGNKEAIKWALRALQGRYSAPEAVVEPKLYGGGDAPGPRVFESQQQLLDAMNKRNDRGQLLYEVDEAYRQNVINILAKSPI